MCHRCPRPVTGPVHFLKVYSDNAALAVELKRLGELVAHTLYECPACGERYLGERRCPDCNRFCRALGLGGACPHCAEPVLLAELLDQAVP